MEKTSLASPKHRNLHIPTRCTLVVNRIYKGATSKDLELEFDRKIDTLLRSLRTHHYSDTTIGRRRFEDLKAQLAENNRKAATKATTTTVVPSTQPTEASVPTNAVHNPDVATPQEPTTSDETNASVQPSTNSQTEEMQVQTNTVYLLETGTLLHMEFDSLMKLDNGEAVFYVPRFCIDELEKMKRDDMRAKSALLKMYDDEIFKKRIIPLPDVTPEQALLPRTDRMLACKRRSRSIVDSAVNLALDYDFADDVMVKVLTTSREVLDLMRDIIQTEDLGQNLSFALIPHYSRAAYAKLQCPSPKP